MKIQCHGGIPDGWHDEADRGWYDGSAMFQPTRGPFILVDEYLNLEISNGGTSQVFGKGLQEVTAVIITLTRVLEAKCTFFCSLFDRHSDKSNP